MENKYNEEITLIEPTGFCPNDGNTLGPIDNISANKDDLYIYKHCRLCGTKFKYLSKVKPVSPIYTL